MTKSSRKIDPVHPGRILKEEFMADIAANSLNVADWSGCSREDIDALIAGKKPVNDHLADGLAQAFGNSRQFWLNLQSFYDQETRK